jgi:hypothetical protein
MEMLDVDNWDNDVEFARPADSSFRALAQSNAMQGGGRFLHFLALKKAFSEEKEYDLILSDVDLADRLEGEVLAIIEGSAKLKLIPVIVSTSSHCLDDIRVCDRLWATCYSVRPKTFWDRLESIKKVLGFGSEVDFVRSAFNKKPLP